MNDTHYKTASHVKQEELLQEYRLGTVKNTAVGAVVVVVVVGGGGGDVGGGGGRGGGGWGRCWAQGSLNPVLQERKFALYLDTISTLYNCYVPVGFPNSSVDQH